MSEITWIKLLIGIFEDPKIKIIKAMPEGRTLVLIWIQLLTQAGKTNDGGWIYFNENHSYSTADLATLFNETQQMIEIALKLFASDRFMMVHRHSDDRILILNWRKHQSADRLDKIREKDAERKRLEREALKNRAINNTDKSMDSPRTRPEIVHSSPALELELDLELDKELKIFKTYVIFDDFWNIYPRKLRKQDAIKTWNKILKDKANPADPSEVIVSAQNYAEECKRKNSGQEYIMHAPTFLNAQRWRDYLNLEQGGISDEKHKGHDGSGSNQTNAEREVPEWQSLVYGSPESENV